jgi:hypothetical protein
LLIIGVGIALFVRARSAPDTSGAAAANAADTPEGNQSPWTAEHEGFLAVATPCCSEASLWDSLDEKSSDGQRARPASAAEAADWLNSWPYLTREEREGSPERDLRVAMQGNEVRCYGGERFGSKPPRDEDVLNSLQDRTNCEYSKWKAWSPDTGQGRLPERHTVRADEDGHFHGQVKYKKAD